MSEQEEQQDSGLRTSPYQSPMYNYGSAIMELTNPEQELIKLELTLRNQVEDSDGNIKTLGEPIMNEEGICAILGLVQSVVNQVTVMSSLDIKKEIVSLRDYLGDCLSKELMLNAARYNLNKRDRDRINDIIIMRAYICMKRAVAGEPGHVSDKSFWKHSVQEITQRLEQQKKPGNTLTRALGWAK